MPAAELPDRADEDAVPADSPLLERLKVASRLATRRLPGSAPDSPAEELAALAGLAAEFEGDVQYWDRYGEGGAVAEVESQVCQLLGKPAAALFPSGIMAQQSVLRVWCDREGSRRVALPELSHLLRHEQDGPRLLHHFQYEQLSTGTELPSADSLTALPGPLGAVLLELPLRDAGYLLPTWDELTGIADVCRARSVPLHLDGARLWESAPYLGHSLTDIAALADSVYVSFYKGLAGLAGAAVSGPEDVIAEARQWRQRMGGTLFTLLPYAAAALRGIRDQLPRMQEYVDRAALLAQRLSGAGFRVFPDPPHTNAFRLLAPVAAEDLLRRLVDFAEAEQTVLTPPWQAAEVPGWSWTEFTVGPATMDWPVEEAVESMRRVLLEEPDS